MSIIDEMGIKFTKRESYRRLAPTTLLLDGSGSVNKYHNLLVSCISDFIGQLRKDPTSNESVLLEIIVFNNNVKNILPFTRIKDIEENYALSFECRYKTHTGTAVLHALDEIERKKLELSDEGIHIYKPNVFLITDGNPDFASKKYDEEQANLEEAYRRIHEFDGNFYVIGVGEHCNPEVLDKLAGGEPNSHLTIESARTDFRSLFKLMTDTVSNQSNGGGDISNEDFRERLEEIKRNENAFEDDLYEEDDTYNV